MSARWNRTRSLILGRCKQSSREAPVGQDRGPSAGRIHRLGLAGNVVALAVLVLVCANSELLLHERRPSAPAVNHTSGSAPPGTEAGVADRRHERLVLVVIDGLRADTAFNPQQMPFLSRLADEHGRATARVESLIPSSIAGIATITTGSVPPPISFLSDFGAGAARHGGVLQAVAADGGRCFVAGPKLWTDLYGQWIAAAELDTTFGRRDERLTEAALAAIASGQYRLVVLHLGRVDAAAHHFGVASAEHAAAAAACDRAVRDIHTALPAGTGLIATSDHGNTQAGGHAGADPAVVTTPLVIAAQRRPDIDHEMPQSRLAGLIAEHLGVVQHLLVDRPSRISSRMSSLLKIGTVALAMLCGLALCSATSGRSSGSRQAFALNSAVWLGLVLCVLGQVETALLAGLSVLAAAALSPRVRIAPVLIGCCALGGLVGGLRLWDGAAALDDLPPSGSMPGGYELALAAPLDFLVSQSPLAIVFLISIAVGVGLQACSRGTGSHALTGAALVGAYVVLNRILGETVSLSSIAVRPGFCFVHLPGGLLWACLWVLAGQAAPAAGLLLGSRAALLNVSGQDFGKFVSGAAAMLLGQLLLVACLFGSPASGQTLQALGLGLLARVIAESSYFFIGLSVILLVSWLGVCERRWGRPHIHLPLADRACYNLRAHRGL